MNWVKNPAGFCKYHHMHLSVKRIKKKKCVEKHCFHLVKLHHHWWEQLKEEKKQKSKRDLG